MEGVRASLMISMNPNFKRSALLSPPSNVIWSLRKKDLTVSSEVRAKCYKSTEMNNKFCLGESGGSIEQRNNMRANVY